jgi:hypothetical protein
MATRYGAEPVRGRASAVGGTVSLGPKPHQEGVTETWDSVEMGASKTVPSASTREPEIAEFLKDMRMFRVRKRIHLNSHVDRSVPRACGGHRPSYPLKI